MDTELSRVQPPQANETAFPMSSCHRKRSSSCNDDDDSSVESSIWESSAWNQWKANRPVRGRPLAGWKAQSNDGSNDLLLTSEAADTSVDNGDNLDPQHQLLLQKRLYKYTFSSNHHHVDDDDQDDKSDLERAVLFDCLSTHVLFAHLTKSDLQKLVTRSVKITLHRHEVLEEGGDHNHHDNDDDAWLYFLYRGELTQPNATAATTRRNEKYIVVGEWAFLSGTTAKSSSNIVHGSGNKIHAASEPCILFGLSRRVYLSVVAPLQRPQQLQSTHENNNNSSSNNDNNQPLVDEQLRHVLQQHLPPELLEYLNDDPTALTKLASGMTARCFQKGDVLVRKRDALQHLVVVTQGQVAATQISSGGRTYEDMLMGPGQPTSSFGWHAVLRTSNDKNGDDNIQEESSTGKIVAKTDGQALVITKEALANVFLRHIHLPHDHHSHPSLEQLSDLRFKRMQLQQIAVFKDSALSNTQISGLLDLMHHFEYHEGEYLFRSGDQVEAAMYFVRRGSVHLQVGRSAESPAQVIDAAGYFGEKNMLLDQNKTIATQKQHYEFRSPSSAMATAAHTKVDVLYLEECRAIVNTTRLGLGTPAVISPIDPSIRWEDITRHLLLGSGSFGQVWSASVALHSGDATAAAGQASDNIADHDGDHRVESNKVHSIPKRRFLALKIQPKHQLLQADKAERIVAERNILAALHSPFVIHLLQSFQDDYRLYMITPLYPGGELEFIIPEDGGLSESAAKFYAGGILEGLAHLHRHHIIHRDVKPGNVLIDEKGYPVLIDLGFAKYVPDKTYTFCGSPMFTAPEIIQYKGYDKGVDHWSWGVTTYRLVTGRFPFYESGMDELTLYKRICKGTFAVDGLMSVNFRMLMVSILYPNPEQRLGSRINGWRDIFASPWFAQDDAFQLRQLRKQRLPAPWVPKLKDPLTESTTSGSIFQQQHLSNVEDLMDARLPRITEQQQLLFSTFGDHVSE